MDHKADMVKGGCTGYKLRTGEVTAILISVHYSMVVIALWLHVVLTGFSAIHTDYKLLNEVKQFSQNYDIIF